MEYKRKNIIIDIPFNIDLSLYSMDSGYIYPKLKESFKKSQQVEWIMRRLSLFMAYTVKSLENQSDQGFRCLVRCNLDSINIIMELLQAYPRLPRNIVFTVNADKIIENSIHRIGNLYRVVIDSDNMYHKDFIRNLKYFDHHAQTQTILCREGYIYDIPTNRAAVIHHQSPSFYAAIYNNKSYPVLYKKRLFEDHWKAIAYKYEVMEGKNYCICTHEQNVDNNFDYIVEYFKARIINGVEKKQFLQEWNIK